MSMHLYGTVDFVHPHTYGKAAGNCNTAYPLLHTWKILSQMLTVTSAS